MDRLGQLKAAAGIAPNDAPPPGFSTRNYDEEAESHNPTTTISGQRHGSTTAVSFRDEADLEAADVLSAFIDDVRSARKLVDEMKDLTLQLQVKHSENIQSVDAVRAQMLRSDIEQISSSINEKAKSVKNALDVMSKKTAALRETPESAQANPAIIRIQDNQYAYLLTQLTTAMAEYQRQQAANEACYKAQTQRQIKIKYTNTDGSAIDDATAAQLAEQVMDNNLNSYVFQQSKDVLASIIETRNDIYRIEQSMRDLNQLFNDLAFLVNEQGELMDIILANIQASTRYVQAGRKELKKARKYQKKSRKKMICIIVCVAVIIGLFILAGVLGGTL